MKGCARPWRADPVARSLGVWAISGSRLPVRLTRATYPRRALRPASLPPGCSVAAACPGGAGWMAIHAVRPESPRSIDRPSLLRRSPVPMRRRRPVPGDPNSVVRNVEAESESDESCKMIRARHAICTRMFGVNRIRTSVRAKCARRSSRCIGCGARVAFRLRAMRRRASRDAFPPRAIAAGRWRLSRARRAARRRARPRRCSATAGGSAGCPHPARAHAPPSR